MGKWARVRGPDSLERIAAHLRHLRRQRRDTALLRMRDRLFKFHTGYYGDDFSRIMEVFDEAAVDRRVDGALKRYALAHACLVEACQILLKERNNE